MTLSLARQNVGHSYVDDVVNAHAQAQFGHNSIRQSLIQPLFHYLHNSYGILEYEN